MAGICDKASPIPKLDLVRMRSKRSAQASERSPLSPIRPAKARANFLMGALAGCISIQFHSASSLARRPALIREDFPEPEPPTMATKRFCVTCDSSRLSSSSRPKKYSWSPYWKGRNPINGHSRLANFRYEFMTSPKVGFSDQGGVSRCRTSASPDAHSNVDHSIELNRCHYLVMVHSAPRRSLRREQMHGV